MGIHVVRMQVFEKLIAKDDVGAGIRNGKLIAVINHQFKIWRCYFTRRALVGNIDSDYLAHFGSNGGCEPAIAGREFEKDRVRLKKRAQETKLREDFAAAVFRRVTPDQARMIRDAREELAIEGGEKRRAFRPRGLSQTSRQLPLHLIVQAEAIGSAM